MLRFNQEFFRCDTFMDYLRWLKRPIPACKAQPHQSKVTREYPELFRRFLTKKNQQTFVWTWEPGPCWLRSVARHVWSPWQSSSASQNSPAHRQWSHCLRWKKQARNYTFTDKPWGSVSFYQRYLQDHKNTSELKVQSEELLVSTLQNKVLSILSGWGIGEFLATFSIRTVFW